MVEEPYSVQGGTAHAILATDLTVSHNLLGFGMMSGGGGGGGGPVCNKSTVCHPSDNKDLRPVDEEPV